MKVGANCQDWGEKVSEPDGEYQKQDRTDDGGKVEDENAEQEAGKEASFLGVLWMSIMLMLLMMMMMMMMKLHDEASSKRMMKVVKKKKKCRGGRWEEDWLPRVLEHEVQDYEHDAVDEVDIEDYADDDCEHDADGFADVDSSGGNMLSNAEWHLNFCDREG